MSLIPIIAVAGLILIVSIYLMKLNPEYSLVVLILMCVSIYWIKAFAVEGYYALTGDGLFMTSFVTKVMNGKFFGDYFTLSKPVVYPPGYFWLTGIWGKIFGLNSYNALKSFAAVAFIAIGLVTYFIGRNMLGRNYGVLLAACALFLMPKQFVVDEYFYKPYGTLVVILLPYFTYLLGRVNITGIKSRVRLYVVGGLAVIFHHPFFIMFGFPNIFMTFLFNVRKVLQSKKNILQYVLPPIILALVIYLAFFLPSAFCNESVTLQARFRSFVAHLCYPGDYYFSLFFVTLNIGNMGSLFFPAVICFIFYFKKPLVRKVFLPSFLSGYLFFLISQLTNHFFKLHANAYLPMAISGAALYPTAYLLYRVDNVIRRKFNAAIFTFALIFLTVVFFYFGLFSKLNKNETQEPYFKPLDMICKEIQMRAYPKNAVMLLSEGTYLKAIPSVIPVYLYLSPSEPYSHPTTNFYDRMYELAMFAGNGNPAEFYSKSLSTKYGPIIAWGLKKEGKGDEVRFIFHQPLPGGICNWQYFNKNSLDNTKYYDKIYEDSISILYLAKPFYYDEKSKSYFPLKSESDTKSRKEAY